MADKTLSVKLIIRNDTAANWNNTNPILVKGEMGVEIDTRKFKFGDGVSDWKTLKYANGNTIVKEVAPTSSDFKYDLGSYWIDTVTKKIYVLVDNTTDNAVWKQLVTTDDLANFGAGDMLKSVFATNAKAEQGYVDKAVHADALTKAFTIVLNGDVFGTVATDGTSEATINATLSDTGVTAGVYTKVTVDAKGRVTVGDNLAVADIPDLTLSKISDAGTAANKDVGVQAGNVPVIGEDGKIDSSLLPSISIVEVHVVNSEEEMLALVATKGSVAIRTDLNESYILKNDEPSVLENWVKLNTPTDTVLSVNGKTGAVVLTTSDIQEGTNLYYTEERATANFGANIAKTNHTALADGDKILTSDDNYIFDGGNA